MKTSGKVVIAIFGTIFSLPFTFNVFVIIMLWGWVIISLLQEEANNTYEFEKTSEVEEAKAEDRYDIEMLDVVKFERIISKDRKTKTYYGVAHAKGTKVKIPFTLSGRIEETLLDMIIDNIKNNDEFFNQGQNWIIREYLMTCSRPVIDKINQRRQQEEKKKLREEQLEAIALAEKEGRCEDVYPGSKSNKVKKLFTTTDGRKLILYLEQEGEPYEIFEIDKDICDKHKNRSLFSSILYIDDALEEYTDRLIDKALKHQLNKTEIKLCLALFSERYVFKGHASWTDYALNMERRIKGEPYYSNY